MSEYGKTSLKIEGLAELLKELDKLPDDLEAKAFKTGFRRALKFLVEKIKARIVANGNYQTGRLYRAIKAGTLKKGRNGQKTITSKIGAQYSGPEGAPHAHLVELGYKHRSGKHVPGRSFLLSTAEAEGQSTINKLIEELKDITEKALKRYHKKYGGR